MNDQQVITRTGCFRCPKVEERNGAEAGFPPVGWAAISVSVRHEGTGWTNNTRRIDSFFCPDCTEAVCRTARGESE